MLFYFWSLILFKQLSIERGSSAATDGGDVFKCLAAGFASSLAVNGGEDNDDDMLDFFYCGLDMDMRMKNYVPLPGLA